MFETELSKTEQLIKKAADDFASLEIARQQDELEDLKAKQADPELYSNIERMKKLNIEIKMKENAILPWLALKSEIDDLHVLIEMAEAEGDESQRSEIEATLAKAEQEEERLEIVRMFTDEDDNSNCYLSIHAGAGGTEACDWAEMLYRMYSRWIEKRNFDFSVIDYQSGEEAGIKSVSLIVRGAYAFGELKSEIGIHRLVRISPFDSNKRRHTSFVSVYVTPEVDETIDIEIETADLRIDTYRSSGAGGQHVNTTDSAVRITHIPTGIVVSCQNERSQIQNRETAMKMLRAKLYEQRKAERAAELEEKSAEKKKIEWGSQIRSYVFHPYNMVKDHRTNYETANTQAVMDGEIDPFIRAWLKM